MDKRIPRLGEILIQKGWITWEQLDEALRIQNLTSPTVVPSSPAKKPSKETFLNIGEILTNQGWIKAEDLSEALRIQKETGDILGSILIKKNFVTEKNLQHALAIQHGLSFADLDRISIPEQVIQLIPKRVAYDHKFIPLVRQSMTLLIAIANPKDVTAEKAAEQLFPGYEILKALMTASDLKKALEKYYGPP